MDYYDHIGAAWIVNIEIEMNLRGKTVLVLGMGETGLSMVKWLTRVGANVRVADSRMDAPNWGVLAQVCPTVQVYKGKFEEEMFVGIEVIAISPGVPLTEPYVQQAQEQGIPIVGDIELFSLALEQNDTSRPKILAITGSNGKTTVTAMVGAMLKRAGWDVEVAGNIGPAVLDVLMQRMDAGKLPQSWVLEVSSFQLETTQNLDADVATVLNLSEDHLDRYIGMQDYIAAKARIFTHKTHDVGIQILNRDDQRVCALALIDRKQLTFGLGVPSTDADFGLLQDGDDIWLVQGKMQLMKLSELMINGLHNALNALAALAICRAMGLPIEPLLSSLREFRGLPHRMEKITTFNGVTFYDDSKSTNVGATVAALNGMQQNVILIAGGEGKKQDFSPLKQAVADCACAVVLIGRDAEIIADEIEDSGVPLYFADTMEEATQKSFLLAQEDDSVLLSPACASFDMFTNYIHRAEAFVAAVRDMEVKFFSFGHERH